MNWKSCPQESGYQGATWRGAKPWFYVQIYINIHNKYNIQEKQMFNKSTLVIFHYTI